LQADPRLKALFAKSVLEKANIYEILCWFIISKEYNTNNFQPQAVALE
jgi:hypothetical protein